MSKKKRELHYNECTSTVQELISSEEFFKLWQLKSRLERNKDIELIRKNIVRKIKK